ncbi:UNVERIFIED_CONTAM: hypothetical protein Sangu_2958600 [Sesamum angustifolium]|uniref:Uncharacterized protein n=1 Tax=Sesamum angustifolium TaxID=2727405 RepID=A0AAW2IIZ5_9LAMI
METTCNTQALQIVLGTSLVPASGEMVPGSPNYPLIEPPRHSTSLATYLEGLPPRGFHAQQMIITAISEQMVKLVPTPSVTPLEVDVPKEKGERISPALHPRS